MVKTLTHRFVTNIPDDLEDGIIYISMEYATAIHLCCCGCRNQVVTPFSPTDWTLIFDGETVSLDPSIGNWSFKCRSHYWVRKSQIHWAKKWSKQEIAAVRRFEQLEQEQYYENKLSPNHKTKSDDTDLVTTKRKSGIWSKLKRIGRKRKST